jgi:hypothetical protein
MSPATQLRLTEALILAGYLYILHPMRFPSKMTSWRDAILCCAWSSKESVIILGHFDDSADRREN